MRRETIAWPNGSGNWPADFWGTLDTNGGAGSTFSQQAGGIGRIATDATAGVSSRCLTDICTLHRDGSLVGTFTTPSTLSCVLIIFLRASNDWHGTNTNYPTTGYCYEFEMIGNTYNAYKTVGGTIAGITGEPAAVSFTWAASTRYMFKIILRKYFLGMRVWAAASADPGGWAWSLTDPDASIACTTTGRLQWSLFNNTGAARNFDFGPMLWQSDLQNSPPFGSPALGPRRLLNLLDEEAAASVAQTPRLILR